MASYQSKGADTHGYRWRNMVAISCRAGSSGLRSNPWTASLPPTSPCWYTHSYTKLPLPTPKLFQLQSCACLALSLLVRTSQRRSHIAQKCLGCSHAQFIRMQRQTWSRMSHSCTALRIRRCRWQCPSRYVLTASLAGWLPTCGAFSLQHHGLAH